jgi:adenylyl cyclase-associated protein
MSGVFHQINQGGAVTSGLRKVDKSEMTHKNPSLRAGSTVPLQRSVSQSSTTSSKSAGPAKRPKPDSMRTRKPPRIELEAQKWYIENFDNTGSQIVEVPTEQSHSVLISRCNKTVIKINGKCNAISVDNCTALSLIVDTLISSVDVIRSSKLQLQIDGTLPTVLLDQVDGATLYLGKSLNTEVFSSKCTSINLVLQGEDDDKECPVPEQIRSFVKDGVVVSEIVEHAG